MSQAAQNLNWSITNFVDNTPGGVDMVVVFCRRILLATSEGFPATAPTSSRPSRPG